MSPLDKIPLTPNGKLDRKALPDPSQEALGSGEEYVAPRNGEEKILAEVWAGVLKKERVGIHDNYFALGGDSIKAIQVMARLARKGLKLEIRDIFQAPTIAELAGRMTRQASVVSQEAVSGQMPLTAIQRWFFEHFKGTEHHYNQAVLLKTEKPLDEGPLRQVLEGLQTHHDALRMRFNLDIGTVIQNNSGPDHPVSLEVFDISGCTDPASEIEQIAGKIQAGIDLENGPLMKAALFHLDDSDRLLLAIHHLVVDGVSWRILLEDLATGYGQLAAGQRLSFPDKSHSFREWAGKVQEFARSPELLAQIPYWLKTEKHEIAPLPKDNPEGGNRYGDSGSAGFILDERQTSALLEKAGQAYSTEINDLLLTALAQAVSRWSEQADVAIMLEGHGREKIVGDLDISRTVGWFTSMFPVILEITDPGDLRQNIRRVKESLHMVPNRGIGYDILRFISDADSASPLGTGCRPEISFNYLGQFDGIGGDNLFAPAAESTGNHAAPDALRPHTLDVGGIVSGNRLSMQIQYSGQQYQSETIGELMSLFEKELLNLIEHCNNRTAPEKTPADFTCPEISLDEYDSLLGSLSLDPGQVDNIYRLTPLQEGILFYHLYNPDADTYFVQLGLRIEGRLDTTLFTESWRKAAARHDILRTVFHFRNSSQPLQVVLKYLEPEILVDDLREMSAAEQEKHIAGLKTSDRQRGFDLEHGPMLRINLLRLGDTEFELIFSNHHLLMDGWSLPVVFGEVLDIYQAMLENRTPVLPGKQSFSRYIGWLMGRDRDTAASFWQDYLSGYEQEIRLPGSKPAGHQAAEYDYRQLNLELDEATTTRFNDLAAAHNATPSSLLQAVWGVLLARLNNTDDVVFGATVSGRTEEIDGIENMVGMFINTVPVRVRYQRESTFADLLKKIQADSIEARQHHYFPLADIQSHSRLKHDLINHILVFENFPLDEKLADSRESRVGDIAFRITDVFEQTNYDLNFIIVPAKKLLIKTEYNGNAYEEKALGRLLAQFKMLIGEVLTDPEQAIGALDILSPEERNKVVEDFNGTAVAYTEGKSVVDLFDEQAARTPDAVAVVSDGLELTYRELNVRANRLAHYLTNDLGVKSGDIVGLLVERSHQVPVGMLGILKAGAAYLPLDPDYPQSRLDYIAGDNGCRVIVSQENLKDRVNADVRFIDIEEICSGDSAPENLQAEIGPDDISYVIYTSGSTGQPKGVLGTHRCLANLIQWQIDQIGGGYRTVQYAALSFDVSVQEILYSLISGGVLHMIPAALRLEFRQLAAFIGEQQIELITLPFSALNLLFEDGSGIGFVHCLKHVITSGEQLQVTDSLRRYLDNHPDVMLHNQYGPSETHVVTSFSLSAARGNISPLPPIGKPVANTGIYILDSELRPTPLGVAGEIYIGGAHVCRGYLGRPELTGEKFLDSPFVMGDRLYRTGDLGRWLEDGNIEFLGRADNQLKVRGFRIEPGEIEARLRSHPAVREAAVVATGPGSDKELAAYLVADQELDASDLRSYLGEHLPDYMIPAYFVQLDKIPLTPSGKLDRRALPSPDTGQRALTGTYLTPRNELERKIAAAWESVLGLERVGVQDNFFELGGHSLKATRLVSLLHRELELEISLRDIFQMPTVAALAKALEQRGAAVYEDIPALELAAHYPLSHAQRRLWVLDQMEGSSAQYNMPAALLFEGSLDSDALERTLRTVIERHEVLRTTFATLDGEPVQVVHESIDFRIELLDYSRQDNVEEAVRSLAGELAARPFDLSNGPLLRACLVKLDDQKHVFCFNMHHIVSDGWSIGVLVKEIVALYEAYSQGRDNNLPPLRIQYRDYAAWQNELLDEDSAEQLRGYWHETLAGELPVLELPTDRPRPAIKTYNGKTLIRSLNTKRTARLKNLANSERTSLFITLQAIVTALLHRYSGQTDIITGSPVAGRNHPDLESQIGFYVNTLALRNRIEPDRSFREFLAGVHDNTTAALDHQSYPFDRLVDELDLARDMSRTPLFDVMVVLQNNEDWELRLGDLRISSFESGNNTSKFDLTFEFSESDNALELALEFNTDLFDSGRIERMAGHLERLIDEVLEAPGKKISELDILSTNERKQVVEQFNDNAISYPQTNPLSSCSKSRRPEHRTLWLWPPGTGS